jgi:hypothetical protein
MANWGTPAMAEENSFPDIHHGVFKANTTSLWENKCAETYSTDFGWSITFPMKTESDVQETLDIFLPRYGGPDVLVSDGARAFIFGLFWKKAIEKLAVIASIDRPLQSIAK